MVQISNSELTISNELEYILQTKTPTERYNLCSEEKFGDQPQAGHCSGFLVAPDILVTAGHCVSGQAACDDFKWAFGYEMNELTGTPKTLKKEDVYSCKKILHSSLIGDDYGVIMLDRPANGAPLSMHRAEKS